MIEKFLDPNEPGYYNVLLAYLANGWYVVEYGLTYTLLRKDVNV